MINKKMMNKLYFTILAMAVAVFFILFLILLFTNIVYKEKLSILFAEVNHLRRLYRTYKIKEGIGNTNLMDKFVVNSKMRVNEQNALPYNIKEYLNNPKSCDNAAWKQIEQYVDDTQNLFVRKLTNNYPGLSQDDIHTILLMRLNLSNAEIATFYNIQLASLATRRYRLIKKMNVQNYCSIVDFIKTLFDD